MEKIREYNKYVFLLVYLSVSSFMVMFIYLSYYISPNIFNYYGIIYHYNSPFVLLASVSFCLFFSRLQFKNRIVNWIGASCFSVYLFHSDSLIQPTWFKTYCENVFQSSNIMMISMHMALFVIFIFLISIFLDQLRKYLWNVLCRFLKF